MNSDEQRLSQLLKMSVPHPPHALSADQVTTRQVDRSAKSWALPAMATPTCRAEEIVPAVTGMTQAAALQELAAAGYTVTVTTTASGQVPAGTVAAQSPAAGTRLPPGGAVGLVVAAANRTNGGGAGAPTNAPATPAGERKSPAICRE